MRTSSIRTSLLCLLFAAPLLPWSCHSGGKPALSGDGPSHVRAHHQGSLRHGRLPDGAVPKHYDVSLTIDPNLDRFMGQVSIAVELLEPQDVLLLHAVQLDVDRVAVLDNLGRRLKVEISHVEHDELLRLHVTPPMPAGMATVYISYSAAYSTDLSGLYRTEVDGQNYVQSQMQPLSARRVLPCFDEPHLRTPFTVVLTVPDDMLCVANSQAVGVRDAYQGHKAWAFEATPPLPAHLLGIVVGPLDGISQELPVSPQRSYPLDVHMYGTAHSGNKLLWAQGRLGALLQEIEAYVDMPYPFTKLDVWAAPSQSFAAVDNAALLSLREWLVLEEGPHGAYNKRRSFEMSAAYALSQQWFGAWVDMAWWDDAWLSASLANWRGLRAAASTRPGMQFDLEQQEGTATAMAQDALVSTPRLRQPVGSKDDIMAAAIGGGALKGAALLNMFEHGLGKERFREGVRTYLRRNPYQSANSAAFSTAMSDGAAAMDFSESFSSFIDQPGMPALTFAWTCEAGNSELTISQERYRPLGGSPASGTWKLPVCFRVGSQVKSRAPHATCVHLSEQSTVVPLNGCPAFLVPNADGAGYYHSKVSFEQLPVVLRAMTPQMMNGPEYATALDDLAAALTAGALPVDTVITAVSAGLQHPNPRIARKTLALLRKMYSQYIGPDAEAFAAGAATWRTWLGAAQRTLVQGARGDINALNAAHRMGAEADAIADRTDELSLLRHDITHALATLAQDASTQGNLAHAGAHWLDRHETLTHTAPDPTGHQSSVRVAATLMADDVAMALAHGAHAFGAPFVQRLLNVLQHAEDSETRRHVLVALAQLKEGGSLPMVLHAILPEDGKDRILRPQERLPLLRGLMEGASLRDAVWAFMTEHLMELFRAVPEQHKHELIALGGTLCDALATEHLTQVFGPHTAHIPGGKHTLQQAIETSTLCAAQVEASGGSVKQFFNPASSSPAP